MNRSITSKSIPVAFREDSPANFNVFIAYDRPEAAKRALRLVDAATTALRYEVGIHRSLWRFDILGLVDAFSVAVNESVQADLVVVAANGCAELPDSTKAWLEEWAKGTVFGSGALVAFLNWKRSAEQWKSPARLFLQGVAEMAGQEFFLHEFSESASSAHTDSKACQESLKQRAEATSSILEGILKRSQSPAHGNRL